MDELIKDSGCLRWRVLRRSIGKGLQGPLTCRYLVVGRRSPERCPARTVEKSRLLGRGALRTPCWPWGPLRRHLYSSRSLQLLSRRILFLLHPSTFQGGTILIIPLNEILPYLFHPQIKFPVCYRCTKGCLSPPTHTLAIARPRPDWPDCACVTHESSLESAIPLSSWTNRDLIRARSSPGSIPNLDSPRS